MTEKPSDRQSTDSSRHAIGDTDPADEPPISSVYRFLMYGATLPERALRSSSAMIGGVLQKSTELLVPQAFRSSKSYSIFVAQMLDIMTENVGGVVKSESNTKQPSTNAANASANKEKSKEQNPTQVENYVARKTVGNFVDLAGMATLHLSPITILAIVSDIAYGSRTYLKELAEELKREGVIAEHSTVNSAYDLLDAVSNASGTTAQAFDMPPLSVDGLKQTINETQQAVRKINPVKLIPQAEIATLWNDMREMATREKVNMFEISSAMTLYTLNHVKTVGQGALSTIRVAGSMMDEHIFDHYFDSIRVIQREGLYKTLAENAKPYLDAVWTNFSTDRITWTEELLSGRMVGRAWDGFRGWFAKNEPVKPTSDIQSSSCSDNSNCDQSNNRHKPVNR